MVAASGRRAAAASPSTLTAMLCCGRKKDGQHEQTTEMAASPRRQGAEPGSQAAAPPAGPSTSSTTPVAMRQKDFTPMVVQSDFRKVSGISTEIFRQIETVENDHDATTAAALEAVERRGEMLVRILDPRQMGKAASEAARSFLTLQDPKHAVHFVEIVKRPGQTLGLYIREGNGIDRSDGVFISRIALESPVYNSGCLRVGDEILAVNLVDVTRMSLDDVVIIMSIPRRLVLTTRQRRGPPGAMSPPPQRPEHKPPPVVVLKRGLDEEPMDDTTSTSNSNGDRAYQQVGPSARLLATGRPLPGMADLPVHGTFPRDRERSDRDRFREREAGRYPERSAMAEEPRYYDPSMGLSRGQYGGDQYKHPTQRFKSSTLDRSGGYEMDSDLSQVATYQPPPPPNVVTEQPKPGAPQHFHPFERSYPKTLESLAERVHPFYGLQGPGAMNLGLSQQGQGQPMGRASTLGRVRMGPTTPSGSAQQMRGGRLLRSGSDQRLPLVEGSTEFYEYIMSRTNPTRTNLKPGTMHYPIGRQASADSSRVPPPRRRTSVDYASDTEASSRHQRNTFSRRPVPGYAVEESWRPPAALGVGVTPTAPTTSLAAQEASSRSNSLPRDRGGRYRRGVRFEKEPGLSGAQHDSQEDSDGAISAPEMSTSQQQQQQQLQKVLLDQQPASFHGKLSDTPSVFTSAEYKAWLQRTPSTSAIYERLRQGRDALEAQKAAKFTFSAENLMDKTRQEPPYYAYRSHFAAPKPDDSSLLTSLGGGRPPTRAGEEIRGIPQPTPARTVDPRFKLIDINPAEFIKYRCERPNGITPTTSQPGSTNSVGGGPTTPGPGPAPGGVEEGVSGLLWVHLLAGRSLRSTSSRAEPVRDLYCVLESDRVHKARTVIRNGDVNFDWDETFDLDLVVNRELDFLIYSWDPQLRHRLCFKGSLHLIPLLRESPVHQIALKVEPRGTLYLKLRYTEPRAAFRRTPAVRKAPPPLFGVDIETVGNREASGLGVPIIIQKCVEEVERRGMDIVGLYRLCGSATKKRILREAFERNPRLVDLSPDSVPDINVITGLLKEYLRELPEPLFTKCLYQMLVDALAVCLPDDPEGNAKLMFSILECLPKSSRTTLFLLMDHLCLVAAQSDRNKMTPQNLAICFGPVLMLHSDDVTSLDFQKPIGVLKYLVQIWPMKSARAAEAAATASLTLRRLQCPPPPPQQQQQVTPTSAAVAASANPQQVIGPENVPPLPPRPAPRTLQARAGQTKVQHALGVFASAGDVIAARGEADGSPAPMADFLAALDSASANSEDATPASSVTPSLTSPTSTSTSTTTTSASPLQPLVRGIAEGHRSRDCSEQSLGSSKNDAGGCSVNSRKDNTRAAANTEEDTEPEADSDLDSPN